MATLCNPHLHRWWCLVFFLVAQVPCLAQFGGFGGGGAGYNPPAPICKPFKCPSGEKPVGNSKHKIWSYGCKDSGINFMSMGGLDPNNPLGGMKQGSNVDKCCVERDICKQTCGTTSKQCHEDFWACSKKMCKGDQNCELSAMMSGFSSDPIDEEEDKKDPKEEYNYEKDKQKKDCRSYEKDQKDSCRCVPSEDWKTETEANLVAFYKIHNPEKVDEFGMIKDRYEVWKKWTGKETDMFRALATKYKKKTVTIKTKPKPPPYKPPPPLSKEEQEKEDKRMAEQRAKWAEEDKKYEQERKEKESRKAEEKAEKEESEQQRKQDEEDGETVEL